MSVGRRSSEAIRRASLTAANVARTSLPSITTFEYVLSGRALSSTESSNLIVLYLSLMMTPMTGVAALLVWVTPSWQALGWLAVIGFISTLGQQALVRGFRAAEASVVAPFNYGRLIFAAVLAYFFFGEVADLWTWVGATVIFGATIYTARRESRLRRELKSIRP